MPLPCKLVIQLFVLQPPPSFLCTDNSVCVFSELAVETMWGKWRGSDFAWAWASFLFSEHSGGPSASGCSGCQPGFQGTRCWVVGVDPGFRENLIQSVFITSLFLWRLLRTLYHTYCLVKHLIKWSTAGYCRWGKNWSLGVCGLLCMMN